MSHFIPKINFYNKSKKKNSISYQQKKFNEQNISSKLLIIILIICLTLYILIRDKFKVIIISDALKSF